MADAAAELAAESTGNQDASRTKASALTAKPAVVRSAQPVDQALADFNAEMADLGEAVETGCPSPSPSPLAPPPLLVACLKKLRSQCSARLIFVVVNFLSDIGRSLIWISLC